MSSGTKWTVVVGFLASVLAATTIALLTHGSALSWLGWAIFFESLQLPMVVAARRGHVDPCIPWLMRVLGQKHGDA
jgi:hypothetical protein